MRSAILPVVAAILAQQVAGHATFQQLWVNGVDQICRPIRILQVVLTNWVLTSPLVSGYRRQITQSLMYRAIMFAAMAAAACPASALS